MSSETYERIRSNPKFQELVSRRSRLAWTLSAIVLVGFYGFVMVVAFAPSLVGLRIGGSTLTVGVAAGLTMFVAFWLLTALYVRRANGQFDALTAEIIADAKEVRS
jgi:cation/acetate symporter